MRKIVAVVLAALAVSASAAPRFRWGRIPDSYRAHRVYLNYYGNEIGNYYSPRRSTLQVPADVPRWTAQCYEGTPAVFINEAEARAYVLACPAWN